MEESVQKQRETERVVLGAMHKFGSDLSPPLLSRGQHQKLLLDSLSSLPPGYSSLDASRPWIVYWVVGALSLLEVEIPLPLQDRVVDFLKRCQSDSGGFGGGPRQLAHLAPTYASVNAIATLSTPDALDLVDRKAMYGFLMKMKQPNGGFRMHDVGEVDVRSTYCALSVASILNILTDELTHNSAEYVASCQTYEGGFGGEPMNEAHGGYTFCGLAASIILGSTHKIDLESLLYWVVHRQMRVEGGFQGRTNKLVDSCYSFWQGALFPMLNSLRPHHLVSLLKEKEETGEEGEGEEKREEIEKEREEGHGNFYDGPSYFNFRDLQQYLLICCQDTTHGGFRDKPPMRKDLYHSFYSLCGLSISQHTSSPSSSPSPPSTSLPHFSLPSQGNLCGECDVVKRVHPVHGVEEQNLIKSKAHFASLPNVGNEIEKERGKEKKVEEGGK